MKFLHRQELKRLKVLALIQDLTAGAKARGLINQADEFYFFQAGDGFLFTTCPPYTKLTDIKATLRIPNTNTREPIAVQLKAFTQAFM